MATRHKWYGMRMLLPMPSRNSCTRESSIYCNAFCFGAPWRFCLSLVPLRLLFWRAPPRLHRCRVDGVMVVVKAYIKRDKREDLAPVEACLSNMAKVLDTRSCPNVLPYQRWLQSDVSVRFGAGTMLNVSPKHRVLQPHW